LFGQCINSTTEYHDYANEDFDRVLHQLGVNAALTKQLIAACTRDLFPVKLHFMVESCSASTYFSDIIRWLPHGRAFVFFNRDRLVRKVLPAFFEGQHKFASFQRQLNQYGIFKLSGSHADKGAVYYHELFLRNRPDLCKLILPGRQETTGNSTRRKRQQHSGPDFSNMAPLKPWNASVAVARPMSLLMLQRTHAGPTWDGKPAQCSELLPSASLPALALSPDQKQTSKELSPFAGFYQNPTALNVWLSHASPPLAESHELLHVRDAPLGEQFVTSALTLPNSIVAPSAAFTSNTSDTAECTATHLDTVPWTQPLDLSFECDSLC
jgi:HSF-type DNA-binding